MDDPALPPDDAIRLAQELLDTGEAFRAHEVLEAVWKADRGPDRELWRALAQLCVGVTHTQRGNTRGARALFERAADNLAGYDDNRYDVDVAGLRAWAAAAAVGRMSDDDPPRLRRVGSGG